MLFKNFFWEIIFFWNGIFFTGNLSNKYNFQLEQYNVLFKLFFNIINFWSLLGGRTEFFETMILENNC